MKTASDSLHQLIHSLSSQEKKYFRKFATRHVSEKETSYLKLFDAIEQQETYNEEALKKTFHKERFILQLFVIKNYLYDMILQSLDAFYKGNNTASELMNMVHYIDILFNKGLYDHCNKIIQKAEKIAAQTENFALHLEILKRKLNIVRASTFYKFSEEEINSLFKEKEDITNKIINLQAYESLNTHLLSKVNKKGWFTRSEEEIKNEYHPIIENELFKNKESALSVSSLILYHSTLSSCYYIMGDKYKSFENSSLLVDLFEKFPDMLHNREAEYVQSISSLVFALVSMGRFKEGLGYINKAKSQKFNSSNLKAKIISSIYLNEIIIYNITGELEKGIEMIPMLEDEFKAINKQLTKTDLCYFNYNFSCLYFKIKDFEKASSYLFKLINDPDIQFLPHIQGNVRILNLMVQFELNNFETLPYLIRSTYRYLLKQQRLFKFESILLKFIKKLPNITSDQLPDEFRKLKGTLEELEQNPYEKNALDFFAVVKWLNNKVKSN